VVSPNVSKILEVAQSLSEPEREELCRLLEQRADWQSPQARGRGLEQPRNERGVIRTVPPKPTPEAIARFRTWKPIQMPGDSLSDELIRDRD
jgi:hypothetical protein